MAQDLYNTTNRLLAFNTVTDNLSLVLTEVEGQSGLDKPFIYKLKAFSDNKTITAEQMLKSFVSFSILHEGEPAQQFCGIVSYFVAGTIKNTHREYELHLVPWFHLMSLDSDCRVFTGMTVPEIFQKVVREQTLTCFYNLSGLKNQYPVLPRCTQYNESSFTFLSRILANAGIFYYWREEALHQTMCLVDTPEALPYYNQDTVFSFEDNKSEHFSDWRPHHAFHAKKYSFKYVNPANPKNPTIITLINPHAPRQIGCNTIGMDAFEKVYYPGLFNLNDLSTVEPQLKRFMQADTWPHHDVQAKSNYCGLVPGMRFQMTDNPMPDQHGLHTVVDLAFKAHDHSHAVQNHDLEGIKKSQSYENQIRAIHQKYPYAPKYINKPEMAGGHAAKVVGPANREIYTNGQGAIKIRFPWQRNDQEQLASWIPVGMMQAGNRAGAAFLPRIGQEVDVHFLDGDPDRPVALNTYPNGKNTAPFSDPADRNKSGFITQTLEGENPTHSNALIFDDTPGNEALTIKAQKDLINEVGNNQTITIQGDDTLTIDGDQLMNIMAGSASMKAESIHLSGGGSHLILDASGVTLQGSTTSGGMVKILAQGVGKTQPVARVGDTTQCPERTDNKAHVGGPITKGATNILANGKAIATVGNPAKCKIETDAIKQGVSSITLNGQPVAILGAQMKHGGVITTGSPNVWVGESTTTGSPGLPKPTVTTTNETGTHWIQATYQGAPKGISWKIEHENGTTYQGTVNESGQTERVPSLPQGSATITFGDREKLEIKLAQERQQLKTALDNILTKTKAAAAKEKAKYAQDSEIDQLFLQSPAMIEQFVEGSAIGAEHFVVGTVKSVAHLFKDMVETQAIDQQAQADSLNGNTQGLEQDQAQMVALGNKEYGGITKGLTLLHLLYEDPKTREILENFAGQYYNSETPIMLAKQEGEFVGGILPGIMVAVITKDPGAISADTTAAAGSDLATVASTTDEMANTIEELQQTKVIENADLDKQHNVYHATTSHEAAQGVMNGIDPDFLGSNSRFGKAFYVSEDPETSLAEMSYMDKPPKFGIRFFVNYDSANILDLTNPEIAESWGYIGGEKTAEMQAYGERALQQSYNAIRFNSERSQGYNLAILDNYNQILSPMIASPASQ